ncbi:Lrp/AsnC family transcriptional regulator [Glacieibacterium sp.]|uniref:Lrp/AsnC family transcriptional regulator n=1 Tax=Glacieibacterium sp. TaxID=2860237 RepID=UPI003B0086EF
MSLGPKLDRLDFKILAYLQNNGRVTNVDLAEAVGLSPSPCLSRVKRLEKHGYIIGYGATINLAKLGSMLTVFTEVTLTDHRSGDFSRFEQRARTVPEIVEAHLVSGGYDYLLKFVARDVSHYQETIESILERDFGIEKYFSYIVIKAGVIKRNPPIDALFDERSE